jgi:taurine dioxygenase
MRPSTPRKRAMSTSEIASKASSTHEVDVIRQSRHLGAEIRGIDLSRPLDDDTFNHIARVFFQHQVVFFRNQKITPEQQIAFTRRFGVLEQHVRKEHRLDGYPEILIVSNVLNEQGKAIGVEDAGRFWHSDLSYKREPSLLSALYALEVPVKDGVVLGQTDFASTTAAYDALPRETKQRIERLRNVHSYRYYRAKNLEAQKAEQARGARTVQEHHLTPEQLASVPDSEAPIVRTHPVTGRKGLFINEAHTSHIVGLPKDEGDALCAELCAHIVAPEFRYEHRWQAGDLLMWDNAAVLHKANFNYDLPLRRLMHRTTVRGPAVA